jgi:hypothetical protein
MRELPQEEWDRRAVPARDRVFAELDPFGAPFTEDVSERALLFPISYELEPGQIAVLRDAARTLGDETIFLEVLLLHPREECYWELSTDDRAPYHLVDPFLETALFSPAGTWGMMISHEDYAVLGGPPDFMRTMAAHFPATALPTQNVFMGGREPEWPDGGSVDEVVDALTAAGTPLALSSGQAFGDGQALAFLEFFVALRKADRHPRDWLAPLLHHLFGSEHAERLLREARW